MPRGVPIGIVHADGSVSPLPPGFSLPDVSPSPVDASRISPVPGGFELAPSGQVAPVRPGFQIPNFLTSGGQTAGGTPTERVIERIRRALSADGGDAGPSSEGDAFGGGTGSEISTGSDADLGGGGSDPGGGGDDSGIGPTSGTNVGTGLLSSEDILQRGRALALQGVPGQLSNLFEALAQLRARATGSTAEIYPAILGQLSQLRSQYTEASQAISRRLGFAGGGQVTREQGRALASAAQQYGGLLASDQTASYANLINTLSSLQPALSGAARPPSVSTQNTPTDFSGQGAGIARLVQTARQIEDFYNSGVSTTGFRNSGIRPENILT